MIGVCSSRRRSSFPSRGRKVLEISYLEVVLECELEVTEYWDFEFVFDCW